MSCPMPDECIIYMKQLENNGRVYPYYYSIWFDVDKDDYEYCLYNRSKKELKKDTHCRASAYRLNIDGRIVSVSNRIQYYKNASKEVNICREVSEQMYQREALWYRTWSSTNRSTYTDLTER